MLYGAIIFDFSLNEKGELKLFEAGDFNSSGLSGYKAIHPEESLKKIYKKFLLERFPRKPLKVRLADRNYTWSVKPFVQDECDALPKGQWLYKMQLEPDSDQAMERYLSFIIAMAMRKKDETSRDILLQLDMLNHPAVEAFLERVRKTSDTNSALGFLQLPVTLHKTCANKEIFHRYMSGSTIYPKTTVGSLSGLNLSDLSDFLAKSDHEYFVLKPTDQSCGSGVVILHKSDVLNYLTSIAKGACKELFWSTHRADPFLLQECCPSKKIMVNGCEYRPTGRLVFAYNDDKLEFMGAYWKLPTIPFGATYCTDSLVSRISSRPDGAAGPISAEISDKDLDIILQQFYQNFPPILDRMLESTEKPAETVVAKINSLFTRLEKPEERSKAIILFVQSLSWYDSLDKSNRSMMIMLFAGVPAYIAKQFCSIAAMDGVSHFDLMWMLPIVEGVLTNSPEWKIILNETTPLEDYQIFGILQGLSAEQVKDSRFSKEHLTVMLKHRLTYETVITFSPAHFKQLSYLQYTGLAKGFPKHIVLWNPRFSYECIRDVEERGKSVAEVCQSIEAPATSISFFHPLDAVVERVARKLSYYGEYCEFTVASTTSRP